MEDLISSYTLVIKDPMSSTSNRDDEYIAHRLRMCGVANEYFSGCLIDPEDKSLLEDELARAWKQ